LITPCYSVLLSNTLYYYIFIYLCILEEKKKNFNKYIYVYKKGNFDYQAPLQSLFVLSSGRPAKPGGIGSNARNKYRRRRVLFRGAAWIMPFSTTASLLKGGWFYGVLGLVNASPTNQAAGLLQSANECSKTAAVQRLKRKNAAATELTEMYHLSKPWGELRNA
jgi:hypothetical protein